jgi:hypothetical protein
VHAFLWKRQVVRAIALAQLSHLIAFLNNATRFWDVINSTD